MILSTLKILVIPLSISVWCNCWRYLMNESFNYDIYLRWSRFIHCRICHDLYIYLFRTDSSKLSLLTYVDLIIVFTVLLNLTKLNSSYIVNAVVIPFGIALHIPKFKVKFSCFFFNRSSRSNAL